MEHGQRADEGQEHPDGHATVVISRFADDEGHADPGYGRRYQVRPNTEHQEKTRDGPAADRTGLPEESQAEQNCNHDEDQPPYVVRLATETRADAVFETTEALSPGWSSR